MARYCKYCGREINSSWKTTCYKCYHEMKGDYNPQRLQSFHGGIKAKKR